MTNYLTNKLFFLALLVLTFACDTPKDKPSTVLGSVLTTTKTEPSSIKNFSGSRSLVGKNDD